MDGSIRQRQDGSFPSSPVDFSADRPVVCVQGLGFVGAAMAAAAAQARDGQGAPAFNVIGVDLPTPKGLRAIAALNEGRFPFATTDTSLNPVIAEGRKAGNLAATSDPSAFSLASVVIVDIHLDVGGGADDPRVDLTGLRRAISTIGAHAPAGCLVIVETTVPPGTCDRVVAPELATAEARRGLATGALLLAHSYERVMPGADYLDSIVNYWRVYAGHTDAAADACAAFLGRVINTEAYPLIRLASTTASETAKVLENSYRATTIAFMEEWGRFAESVGIDLFEVVAAIRHRPTHSNMRQPGFGVGGYCLTKDPLLPIVAARDLFGHGELDFPFSRAAVKVNRAMPLVSVEKLEKMLGGLAGRTVLLLGVSYRPDVADTRFSPSEIFAREIRNRGARILCHDPLVRYWEELGVDVPAALPEACGVDGIVLAVAHDAYRKLNFPEWLGKARPAVLDANNVLDDAQRRQLETIGVAITCIGRGSGT